jgi:hypothetical protein
VLRPVGRGEDVPPTVTRCLRPARSNEVSGRDQDTPTGSSSVPSAGPRRPVRGTTAARRSAAAIVACGAVSTVTEVTGTAVAAGAPSVIRARARLRSAASDLLARLPDNPAAAQARYLQDAEEALVGRDPGTAISLCRKALSQVADGPADAVRARHYRHQAQRLIIEALTDSGDWPAREFPVFLAMTEPAVLHAGVREQLLHNIGPVVALEWLASGEPPAAAGALLRLITAPDVAGPVEAAFPGPTAARIRLLRACGALAGHDSQAAAAHLRSALADPPADSRSPRDAARHSHDGQAADGPAAARPGGSCRRRPLEPVPRVSRCRPGSGGPGKGRAH